MINKLRFYLYKMEGNVNKNIEFYKMQFEWIKDSGMNFDSYMDYSKSRVDNLLKLLETKPQSALELGSGMGMEAINLNLKGIDVDAIEIVEVLHQYASNIQGENKSSVNFIKESFFNFHPQKNYDLIYYLDGFGVSSDSDQALLLKNIYKWLNNDGTCILEIYNPLYWKKIEGKKMQINEDVSREYGYDYNENALVDTWISSKTGEKYSQSIKCYDLDMITEMLKQSGLRILSINPGGAMNFDKNIYVKEVALDECMNYKLVLKKALIQKKY